MFLMVILGVSMWDTKIRRLKARPRATKSKNAKVVVLIGLLRFVAMMVLPYAAFGSVYYWLFSGREGAMRGTGRMFCTRR